MRIAIIQGHPDARGAHFGHALASAYEAGARERGHEVRRIDVVSLAFPLLRTQQEFADGSVPRDIQEARESIAWAQHLVALKRGVLAMAGIRSNAYRGRWLARIQSLGRAAR